MTYKWTAAGYLRILLALALVLAIAGGPLARPAFAFSADMTEAEAGPPQGSADGTKPVWFRGKPNLSWEPPAGKSYAVPAVEIAGFIVALNGLGRLFYSDEEQNGRKVYQTTPSTIWNNATHLNWGTDTDTFKVNQLLHPYQGSIYHEIARSTGLTYWESSGYTFLGSALWEIAGETTRPSINDQIASGIAGSFLGESLFRMSSLLLEGHGQPGFWRELAAAALSPPTGFNRLVFGERFDAVFPSHNPATFWRLRTGLTFNTDISDRGGSGIQQNEASATFSMQYGLPGQPGYDYRRPFDYFQFELSAVNSLNDLVGNLTTRGLLGGQDYEVGNDYRGIYGVYGSYDYLSARIFRVSSTAASFGTTAQWWLSRLVALQGSAIAGIGYGAGANIAEQEGRNYHYGMIGQGLLSLRLILGDLVMLEGSGRGYYVSDLFSTQPHGRDLINFFNLGVTFRLYDHHGLSVQFLHAVRDGYTSGAPNQYQRLQSISLVYTYLSDKGFGAVEWRD